MASRHAEVGLSQLLSLRTSPELIAAREMLQLPSIALEAAVEAELGSNPALERAESYECPLCVPSGSAACPLCQLGRSTGHGAGAGREHDPLPAVPYRENDADILLREVSLDIPSRDFPIAEYLVGNLDDHGFLDQEPGQIAAVLGVSVRRVLEVLGAIQQQGPPGVGTAGVRECLLLQLEQVAAEDDLRCLARSVIEDHLPALARGRLTAICRELSVGRAALDAAAELIRTRLQPYPAYEGRSLTTSPPLAPCVPDVVVSERGDGPGGFDVELVEPRRFRLRINPAYLEVTGHIRSADQGHVRASLAEARSFLARLEDRWRTLRRVAELVTEFQCDFVRRGPLCLRPLTRAQVARELLMHESTVSRAVVSKYVLLPSRKVITLAEFFSSSGGLGEEIRAMIAAETHPLSDGQLTACLRERGYQVARRTVTKYRLRAGIPAAAAR
jgi:RNA polymerase sigma-54 factor